MDKINFVNDNEQNLASEEQVERPLENSDIVAQLAPESFSLIGGGAGILHF